MKVEGGCHCGAIRYEATVDEQRVHVCNCTDCQRLSGSAFRVSVYCERTDFRLLQGTPAEYSRTAQSGRIRLQGFCADCGSDLYSVGTDPHGAMALRIGCIDQRRALVPALQTWRGSALAWAQDLQRIPFKADD